MVQGDLVQFNNLGEFLNQFPNPVFEDFEEARFADGTFGEMENILNSSTNNGIFVPGEIVDGLQLPSDAKSRNGKRQRRCDIGVIDAWNFAYSTVFSQKSRK